MHAGVFCGEGLQGVIAPLMRRRLVQTFNWQEDTLARSMIYSANTISCDGWGGHRYREDVASNRGVCVVILGILGHYLHEKFFHPHMLLSDLRPARRVGSRYFFLQMFTRDPSVCKSSVSPQLSDLTSRSHYSQKSFKTVVDSQ